MNSKTTRISTIPPWFEIENYKALPSTQDPECMFSDLYIRKLMWDSLNDESTPNLHESSGFYEQITSGRPDELLGVEQAKNWKQSIKAFENGRQHWPGSTLLVSPIGLAHIKPLSKFISKSDLDDLAASYHLDYPIELIQADTEKNDANAFDKSALVSINLEASDDSIIRDLRRQLCVFREVKKVPEPVRRTPESEYRKLINYQILACLDLLFWEKVEKKKIDRSVFAAALFSSHGRGGKSLIDTIRTFAEKSMTDHFINEISALATELEAN
ncbi:MAG: DUF6387 family protein [Halopseudomonas sp.]